MSRRIHIVYPEDRWISEEEIISQARDDIANGKSAVADRPQDITELDDAIAVVHDSGTMTVDWRGSGL